MPKITEVSPQKRTLRQSLGPKRFNVFLDGRFAFGADEDLVVNYRLLPGKEVSSSNLGKLLDEAEVGKLMERMYRLFNVRQRSEKEVRNYLRNLSFKGKIQGEEEISDLTQNQVVERLKRKGIVNDEIFAQSWVEARRRSKKLGPRALRTELVQKGINREIIVRVLSSGFRVQSDERLAREALEKKLRLWKNLPPLEFKKKATDFLLRKGFGYSLVKVVVDSSTLLRINAEFD